uniref:ATP-dependent RNA helicase DHX36 n=1 Tax=Haemonchus contortus TaxID=6289 RepID=A0A7I4XVZ3_HAECO
MAYYGNHGKGRTKNLHNSFDRDEPNGFKNPQYGPHVQLIDANWERQVTAKLDEFVNGTATELCFPPMERAERRRLHELARRKGLQTSSEGREPNRRCVVHRRPVPRLAAVGANETQPIRLLPEVRESLSRFISQYPIYGSAVERHVTAPKARDRSQRDISNRERPEMLVPQRSNSSAEMLQQRKMLPAYRQRDDVLRAINDHKVVLITGGTGCGKTTQVPQFLLEHASENNQPLRIVCTQPRRLPAIAVANRVARERGETLGSTVGYHIRLEQRTSPQTVLTYCTSGVLLRMLTQDDAARDISHIILDEIHEREQNTDYLLIALKQALKKRNDLKVILMSATMEGNLKLFTKYFGEKVEVKHVDIPSRLYNVERFFLGDVIAMTGFVPEESMFSSMFMSTGFQEVCSFPTIGDWSMKPEWESELPQPHPRMPETMTAPNLPSLVANNCATPSSSTPVVAAGHLVTSLSVASLSQHSKQQHTVNFMNVAQQLVNSQQSSSTHQQQQAPPSVNIPSQISHPSQQSTMVPTVYPPQPDAIYVQHAPYQQSYGQQPHGYQGGGVRQVYSQQTGTGAALQHSATWGGSMEHSFPGALPSHPDVVDLPSEALDAETLEQFRQMGYNNNDEIMTSVGYGTEWRVPDDEVQPQWQNTQSYSTIPTVAYQQGNLHSWDSQVLYAPQPAPFNKTQQQPVFYVPETCDNLPSTNSVSYFGQSMDGFHVPLHGHNTLSGAATSPANYTQPPPSIQHPHANAGYQQHNVPQPPVDTYASAIQRSEKELEMMRHQLGTALPERPKSFDPSVQQLLATRRIDQSALVNMYLKCGGQQWAEAVDLDLVMTVVKYCMDSRIEGAILVFLPGFDDIVQMRDKITNESWSGRRPVIFTLHSQMNSFDQQKVFDSVGASERKVILSTNIAEASLTIDDVVFVVDCGKVKEKTYDHTSRISQLKITWIAKSNAEQRAGRAGRCREGFCFRLYSIEDYEVMLETQMAEMQRTAIHDVCLHAKMFAPENMTVKQFLQMAPEPPLADAVDKSMAFLEQLGALYSEASISDVDVTAAPAPYVEPQLTDLGRLVAQLPLDPQLARLLLFGVVLRCLSPVVTLVAALSHRDPFILAMSEEREQSNRQRDSFGKRDFSDHITLIRAFNEFNDKNTKDAIMFCRTNYLSLPAMKMIAGIRRQLLIELRRVRMISYEGDAMNALRDATYNSYSSCWPMVQAAIVAGCYPGIGFVRAGNKLKKIRTSTEAAATLHPSSVIKRQVLSASKRSEIINQYVVENSEDPVIEYLAFHELAKIDEGLTLRTVTVVPPCAVVLFAGSMRLKKSTIQNFDITNPDSGDEGDVDEEGPRDVVYPIEHWIGVRATYSDMKRLMQLRFKVMSYFLAAIHKPQLLINPQKEDLDLLETLALVLKADHQQMKFNPCNLPEPQFIFQQHQVPSSSSASSYNSHNGPQVPPLRFSHREGSSSQPNMSTLVENAPKLTAAAPHPEIIPPPHPATGFQTGSSESHRAPNGDHSSLPLQQDRDLQDRYVGQRQQPRRQVSGQDDYGYQKSHRDNYDQRRFNRNRDEWQNKRPYQQRDGNRDKSERAQNFRDHDRERNLRDDAAPGSSQQQLPRRRIQNYNNRDRDCRQNNREWGRGEQMSGLDQLTWQQREMERNDNYRDRQGRRDYNYRQRQYNKYDDDREEPVPEDPRVDRNDDDGWGEADYQAAGYHHDQVDHQPKHNRHYHRPYNAGAYHGRNRGHFSNRQGLYNRDDGRRDMQNDERSNRDNGDNKEHEANSRGNERGFYRQGGSKIYDNTRSIDHDREKHSEKSRVFYNSNKNLFSDRRRRGSNSNYS